MIESFGGDVLVFIYRTHSSTKKDAKITPQSSARTQQPRDIIAAIEACSIPITGDNKKTKQASLTPKPPGENKDIKPINQDAVNVEIK